MEPTNSPHADHIHSLLFTTDDLINIVDALDVYRVEGCYSSGVYGRDIVDDRLDRSVTIAELRDWLVARIAEDPYAPAP